MNSIVSSPICSDSSYRAQNVGFNSPSQSEPSKTVCQQLVQFFRGLMPAPRIDISCPSITPINPALSHGELASALSAVSTLIEKGEGTIKDNAPFAKDVAGSRFKDIATAMHSVVRAPDGTLLPANRVHVNGHNVAIASQYPTDTNVASYLSMLAANNTPVLVVLASDKEIANKKETGGELLPYFRESKDYGNVQVASSLTADQALSDGDTTINLKQYHLEIKQNGKTTSMPVVHVTNWPDHGSISAGLSKKLVEHIATTKAETLSHTHQNSEALPVIHCRAGVGRTGQLIAATELLKKDGPSLETIIKDMRFSRNRLMVQTPTQLDALAELAKQEGVAMTKAEALARIKAVDVMA